MRREETSQNATSHDLLTQFPGLSSRPSAVRDKLRAESRRVHAKAGDVVFAPGRSPETLLFLTSGAVRVQQRSDGGREIVLYRVEAGQSCVMTAAATMAFGDHEAEGVAETDVAAAALSNEAFDALLSESRAFRRFVMTAYARRISDLFRVIDDVAFGRLDVRLAQRLLDMADSAGRVTATHQSLASELGTAREVVSRTLQDFQRRGWIAQSRGAIALLTPDAIAKLADR